jgi:hypothetical protein
MKYELQKETVIETTPALESLGETKGRTGV